MHIRTLATDHKTVMLYIRGPSQPGYRWELVVRRTPGGTRSIFSDEWYEGWKRALEAGLSAQDAEMAVD